MTFNITKKVIRYEPELIDVQAIFDEMPGYERKHCPHVTITAIETEPGNDEIVIKYMKEGGRYICMLGSDEWEGGIDCLFRNEDEDGVLSSFQPERSLMEAILSATGRGWR